MSEDNVVRLVAKQTPREPEALGSAIHINLQGNDYYLLDLIQVGTTADGGLFFHSSNMSAQELVGLLEFAKYQILSGGIHVPEV
jgi:hypothetical protein